MMQNIGELALSDLPLGSRENCITLREEIQSFQADWSANLSAAFVSIWQTQRPRMRSTYVAAAIASDEGKTYDIEKVQDQTRNATQPIVKRIPKGAMIPTTAKRLRNVISIILRTRNRPVINAIAANSRAIASTIICTGSDKMVPGTIHLAAVRRMPTGKHTASKSVIAIFAKENDNSVSSARKNGSNTAQPTTPVIAKYGSAKISSMFDQLQVLQAFLLWKRASKLKVETIGALS
jgi:hypothetical protein